MARLKQRNVGAGSQQEPPSTVLQRLHGPWALSHVTDQTQMEVLWLSPAGVILQSSQKERVGNLLQKPAAQLSLEAKR